MFKNTVVNAWQYASFLDVRFGQNQSQGLINRLIVEDSTFTARGGEHAFYVSDSSGGSDNFIFRRSFLSCLTSRVVRIRQISNPATQIFSNWLFENCTLKDNSNLPAPSPDAGNVNGIVSIIDTGLIVAQGFVFRNCRFEGGIGVRVDSSPAAAFPCDGWIFENCTAAVSTDMLFARTTAPMSHWTIRNCNFTALRIVGDFKGQFANSLIEDCTFTVPDSTKTIFTAGVFAMGSSGGANPLQVTNHLTINRCRFASQRAGIAGFRLDGVDSINLSLTNCTIVAPNLGMDCNAGRSHANLLLSNCSLTTTAAGKVAELSFAGGLGQTFSGCSFNGSGIAEGLTLGNATTAPANTQTLVSNCNIHDVSGGGIKLLASASGVTIQGCTVMNVTGANTHGISLVADSLTADTTGVTLTDCWIGDVPGFGISLEGSNQTLQGNTIVRAAKGGIRVQENPALAQLFVLRPYHNVTLERNCVYGNSSPVANSIGIDLVNPSGSSSNLRIVNNTLLLWQDGLTMEGANVRDADVINNIFSSNTGVGLKVAGSGHVIGFNGYFANGSNATGVTVPGNGDVVADPLFLSTTPGNANFLVLGPSSLMIDAGSLDGVNKHLGAPGGDEIDIGCHESGVSAVADWRLY